MVAKKDLTSEEQLEKLKAELALLQGKLEAAEERNVALDERSKYFASADQEVPTGRTVTVRRCKNPWVKKEELQEWEEKEVPTYYLNIDMPPLGGFTIKIDGEDLQQGQTYEMTIDRVRLVKDIQYRLRAHDASVHGNDEDTWRPRISKEISVKTGAMRNLPPNWLPGMPVR